MTENNTDYKKILEEKRTDIEIVAKYYKKKNKEVAVKKTAEKAKDKELIGKIDTFFRELVSDEELTDTMKKLSISEIPILRTHLAYDNYELYLTRNGMISCKSLRNNTKDSYEGIYDLQKIPQTSNIKEKKSNNLISECFKDNKAFVIKNQKQKGYRYLANKYLDYKKSESIIEYTNIKRIKESFNNNLECEINTRIREIKNKQ